MSNRISGRRYDDGPRLNMKKVFATVIAIIVIIMIIVSLKKLLTNTDNTKDVSTLVDGESIKDESELNKLLPLELLECIKLKNSYIELKYKVIK